MKVHATLSSSEVNGPGPRAVVWFQGCSLACPGCWNPETHAFALGTDTSPAELVDWILSCTNIEGVTFSGGEPFQQAIDLLHVCELLKQSRPAFSLGIFSGYSIRELEAGRFQYRRAGVPTWLRGSAFLYQQIRTHLDFGIFGRFTKALYTSEKPLCGSKNQDVVFFSDRYSAKDLQPQTIEILISEDGMDATFTGFPPAALVTTLKSGN